MKKVFKYILKTIYSSRGRAAAKIRLAALLAAILLTASAPVFPALAERPLKIYAFGDSITYGFAQTGSQSLTNSSSFRFLLAKKLSEIGIDARIVNGGVPGETVLNARSRFDKIFLERPDAVIIMFGTNDCKAGEDGRSQVPLASYKAELENFVKRLLEKGIGVILMTSPPLPTDNIKILTNRHLKPYIFAAREIAIKNRIDLVDNFMLFNDAAEDKNLLRFFLPDMIHPNEEGHKIIADGLFNVFEDGGSHFNSDKAGARKNAAQKSDNSKSEEEPLSEENEERVNYASEKPYIESSKNRGCEDGVLTDGVKTPAGMDEIYYTSAGGTFPKWVIIDLGKRRTIKSVVVYNSKELDSRNITVYYGRDLGKYSPAGSSSFKKPSSRLVFNLEKPSAARYIKVDIEDAYGDKNKVSLAEIEVFGTR
ncbi:MAG TPA: GDSL-type esterase/lipase family protein [Candidatus Wallbacteria bacterium]|nr:GDSL-type esterase/lipase family protein [Candidatus Wallbacteria bacterium]